MAYRVFEWHCIQWSTSAGVKFLKFIKPSSAEVYLGRCSADVDGVSLGVLLLLTGI